MILVVHSYEIDLRVLFKKFYCPVCGERLKVIKDIQKLTEQQKKIYYKKLYPHGVPINFDVGKVRLMLRCCKCNCCYTADNQQLIHKKQK